jgi:hypothetical protein
MTATHRRLVAFERDHHEEPLRGCSAKQKNGIMDTSQKKAKMRSQIKTRVAGVPLDLRLCGDNREGRLQNNDRF